MTCPLASTEATPVAAGGRCCRLSMVSLTRPRIPPKPTAETGLVSLRPAGASKAPLDRAAGCPVLTPRASRRAASRGQPWPIIRRRCCAAESEVAQPAASWLSGGVLQRHQSSGCIWASTASCEAARSLGQPPPIISRRCRAAGQPGPGLDMSRRRTASGPRASACRPCRRSACTPARCSAAAGRAPPRRTPWPRRCRKCRAG